jgi:tetratricopeptide (TPR) repeat protein
MKKFSLMVLSMSMIFTPLFSVKAFADLDRSKTSRGIDAYDEGQWDKSLQYFQDALLDAPQHPIGHYNVGQALYKKQQYEEALKSYQEALNTDDLALREKIYYNMGNTQYQMNKYQEAIQSYISALDIDPADEDAKHNLELVRAKLKEMAEKQPMQNQQQQQGQQNQEQSQQSQSDQQEKQKQQQEQQAQQQQHQQGEEQQVQEQDSDEQKQEEQQLAQKPEKQKELSKEEAERILQALRSEEKENQKLRKNRQAAGRAPVEKDW